MADYIKKIDFHNILKDYKETRSKKSYEMIGRCFLKISENYLNKPCFINYTQDRKDDMISEGVYDMIRYIDNYNVHEMERKMRTEGHIPNPFCYFTQYARNGIIRYLGLKKKDAEVLIRLTFIENIDHVEI